MHRRPLFGPVQYAADPAGSELLLHRYSFFFSW